MSLALTLYDFQIALSHVDRGIDQPQLAVKVARHPSETMERVWLRVLAFCWFWEDRMTFGKGLSEQDAPDLECRDYTNVVTRWVRVGKADPAKIQRAVDQNGSAQVSVLFESADRLETFLQQAREEKAARIAKAELAAVDEDLLSALCGFDTRRIRLALTFVGDHIYADCEGQSFDGPITRGNFP
jgi:uncharacterized protein YaeQ